MGYWDPSAGTSFQASAETLLGVTESKSNACSCIKNDYLIKMLSVIVGEKWKSYIYFVLFYF